MQHVKIIIGKIKFRKDFSKKNSKLTLLCTEIYLRKKAHWHMAYVNPHYSTEENHELGFVYDVKAI